MGLGIASKQEVFDENYQVVIEVYTEGGQLCWIIRLLKSPLRSKKIEASQSQQAVLHA